MYLNHLIRNKIRRKIVQIVNFNMLGKRYKIMSKRYEEAVHCINSLQSNRKSIENAAANGCLPHSVIYSNTIASTEKYLLRTNLNLKQLDELSFIHVAGTKGKGSTCALCESILREYGYKTGFYSSPHLVTIRERIKLNGKMLSEEKFADNTLEIFNKLKDKSESPDDMPTYFQFMTILAFNTFYKEKVDVILLEVGIGGEFDCTNMIRNTRIVGITSLGLDHTNLLGDTIEQIAWQKSGIMKKNCKAFTCQQVDSAVPVLHERSIEKQCTLEFVPDFNKYLWNGKQPSIGINGNIQKINASIAIQLAHNWLITCGKQTDEVKILFENKLLVPEKTFRGLENCRWPGRCQIIKALNHTFYLDGAHTVESLTLCINWYKNVVPDNAYRVLIFNATGQRDAENLLNLLISVKFDEIIFTPNIASPEKIADQVSLIHNDTSQLEKCESHKQIWLTLKNSSNDDTVNNNNTNIFSSVEEAVEHLPTDKPTHILITGSLHLIGAALSLLDPDLKTF